MSYIGPDLHKIKTKACLTSNSGEKTFSYNTCLKGSTGLFLSLVVVVIIVFIVDFSHSRLLKNL